MTFDSELRWKFKYMQSELGLKLVPKRVKMPYFVVEHAAANEHPSGKEDAEPQVKGFTTRTRPYSCP